MASAKPEIYSLEINEIIFKHLAVYNDMSYLHKTANIFLKFEPEAQPLQLFQLNTKNIRSFMRVTHTNKAIYKLNFLN